MALTTDDAIILADRIEAAISSPQSLAAIRDDSVRCKLRDAAAKLSLALETRHDAIHRIAFSPMQLALARVGVDIGLFPLLVASKGCSSVDLAEKTKVDLVLMQRLLRYYQSVGMILQTGPDDFAANNITDTLAWEGGRAGICVQSDLVAQSFGAFPKFLKETGYANPTDPKHTPFNLGTGTEQTLFEWIRDHPDTLHHFNTWMSVQRDPRSTFLDVLRFDEDLAAGADEKTILFVDIGGSRGHQCIAFREKYPDLKGRVILQDLPHVIDEVKANPLPGFEQVETDTHDMFTPQTIKGARAYYFRNVFHDWPDEKCKEILENLRPALSKDSVVLIDDIVVPDVGASWRATLADMTMAVCLAAMQRSETQWQNMAHSAEFKVLKVLRYRKEFEDAVLVLRAT
ncbi:S-adenosyl-L-methionine-dependent methyltransferase [Cercophora samala]|uniref:S-adenosyl-L-methionine-dependent methyltransferase n=1 Tax=Cercophora samala TaxID=330535 RepID=A0AA40D9U4_9PEZI|nr:S-adenosyl-L-methionine-dependent methyltransferase [Cercophora samala]